MALINTIIPTSAFERIRDRVGAILMEEIANQYTLTSDEDINVARVWVERFVTVDYTDTPTITVSYAAGDLANQHPGQSNATLLYNIDCYASSATINGVDGFTVATFKMHKLMRIVRAILEDAQYKTLGFTPPFVMNRQILSMRIAEPTSKDATSTIMGRLVLSVKVPEVVTLIEAPLIDGIATTVLLNASNLGYYWQVGNASGLPTPTVFLFATKTSLSGPETITLSWNTLNAVTVTISGIGNVAPTGQMEVEATPGQVFVLTGSNYTASASTSLNITSTSGMQALPFTTNGTTSVTVPGLAGKTLVYIAVLGGGNLDPNTYIEYGGSIEWQTTDPADLTTGVEMIALVQ